MKFLRYVAIGILFGITMTKSGAISWFRIQEMFRFESFFMYGMIGSAVFFGVLFVQLIKRFKVKDIDGNPIIFQDKAPTYKRYLIGGILFGLGWSLAGACPGPLYVLLGAGFPAMLWVIVSAILGTFVYGLLRDRLPH